MYALDFEYDGQRLSDFGFIICDFNDTKGFDIVSAGSQITFNTVAFNNGKRNALSSTKYEECIQTTFGICKNPDIFDDLAISNYEYRCLMRWLNRNEYLKFEVLYEGDFDYDPCFYEASFNVEKVKVREILYGLNLTMQTNKPFGYGLEQEKTFVIDDTSATYKLIDRSDEIGFTYPVVKIICNQIGDIAIANSLTNCNMVIRNCKKDEVIIIDCENHILESSEKDHDIYDDFNYDFFCIANTFDTRENYITASSPCSIEIAYYPIIKDTP